MEGIWISKPARDATTSVVFVHGILSSGEACWRHSNGTFWPDLLACDESIKGTGVYVFTYKTGFFSGTYRLGDVVDALKEHMRLDGVINSRRIVFVCHSMGGIVARRLVVQRATELIESGTSIGLFLVASPSVGSSYANWLSPLARFFDHSQADALRFEQNNAWLMDLDRDFQNLKESKRLSLNGKELVEDTFVVLRTLLRKQVVEPFSGARYFGEAYKVPNSDHFSIAKVDGASAVQHRMLVSFLLDAARADELEAPSPPPTRCPPDPLRAALARVASGSATEDDHLVLQRAAFNGALLVLSESQGGSAAASIMSGDTAVPIGHDRDFVRKLRDFLLPGRPGRLPPLPQLFLIGRADALAEIKRRMGIPDGLPLHARTVIRGWPGVGKTTLVNAFAYDVETAAQFPDGVLWTSLTREPAILSEIGAWGRALGVNGLSRSPTVKDAVEQLAELLADARMLIIIDDVWDAAHAQPFLQCVGQRCGVLLTTRLPSVAEELSPTADGVYTLPLLQEDDGMLLLRLLAPTIVMSKRDACLQLVRDLEGLPLALHVAGRMLASEARMGWSVDDLLVSLRDGAALISAKAPADRADIEKQTIPTVAALLQQSTDLLDQRTRECFAFFGAFAPKPATFDLEAIAAVWKADDPKLVVRELAARGLIEPTAGRFQMHALLVAHARSLLDP
ncbi:alpha/beta fold hydrolase [Mesorhizobium waimense]|uniref:Alpha/beta fold hydrolase n=1 Tax=Mesorhizobium waimense TaxID=1300307 RepID=A0A3A5K8P6_9HYPH|nr:alpha/beta fold hydrolase [Mesorhizobium waimense]RJT27260.1 alpha/beta fold hydrolase [Mesorhizobium waimense]